MKIFLTIFASITLLTSFANADMFRLDGGAGVWMQTPKGGMGRLDVSDEKTTVQPYVWAYLKHPIPIIPNLRAEYVGMDTKDTDSDIAFKQFDIIPYYNIVDNLFWITLDVGLDFKIIDGAKETRGTIASVELFPLGYLRSRVQIPFSGVGFEMDGKYISYSHTEIYDARIKIDYTFEGYVVSPAFELGYRVQKIQTDKFFRSKVDLDFSGIYIGVILIY